MFTDSITKWIQTTQLFNVFLFPNPLVELHDGKEDHQVTGEKRIPPLHDRRMIRVKRLAAYLREGYEVFLEETSFSHMQLSHVGGENVISLPPCLKEEELC